jgi:hypothetical protein
MADLNEAYVALLQSAGPRQTVVAESARPQTNGHRGLWILVSVAMLAPITGVVVANLASHTKVAEPPSLASPRTAALRGGTTTTPPPSTTVPSAASSPATDLPAGAPPTTSPPITSSPTPALSGHVWCRASAEPSTDGYQGDYEVSVDSDQPYTEVTASDSADSWSDETDASGAADILLSGTSPGEQITVTIGTASCSTTA